MWDNQEAGVEMLLTDEISDILEGYFSDELGEGAAQDIARELIAKTLKAVAEWLNGHCNVKEHPVLGMFRLNCTHCRLELFEAADEGKMPGEEK